MREASIRSISSASGQHHGEISVRDGSTIPFAGTFDPVVVALDWQNVVLCAAREGLPVDLDRLVFMIASAYHRAEVDLYTTPDMAPAVPDAAGHVRVSLHVQSYSKNCDIDMTVNSLLHMELWRVKGYRVVLATGDQGFLSLHAALCRQLGDDRCGFLTLPGRSTGRKIREANAQVGELGLDVLSDMRYWRAA